MLWSKNGSELKSWSWWPENEKNKHFLALCVYNVLELEIENYFRNKALSKKYEPELTKDLGSNSS